MAMSERTRSKLHQGLRGMMDDDEEAIGEVLSHFPARDVEEPATKELIQTEVALLRVDIAQSESRLRGELGSVRSELKSDIARLDTSIAGLRTELKGDIAGLHNDIAGLRTEVKDEIHSALRWTIGTMLTLAALIFAALTVW